MEKEQSIGYIIVKGTVVEKDFNAKGWTVRDFADALNIEMRQSYELLSGEKIGIEMARKFINHYKLNTAIQFLDWRKMGVRQSQLQEILQGINETHQSKEIENEKNGNETQCEIVRCGVGRTTAIPIRA
jgi:hypothetical protein